MLFIISLFFIAISAFAQNESSALQITHLTGNFYLYTTYGDPGDGSRYPSNSMYLVTNKGVVLFDTPWDSTQFQPLLDSIQKKHHQKVILCIATHFHSDRTAGIAYYNQQGIATYTTQQTDEILRKRNEKRAGHLIRHDTTFTIGQYSFNTIYPGKGHSPDNIVIWFKKQQLLYGGCFIKSTDTNNPGNLSDANISDWIHAIQYVQQHCKQPRYIIPGHLSWASNSSLSHTLELLKKYQREHNPQKK